MPEVSSSRSAALPGGVRHLAETRFGADFSKVRIHSDSAASDANRRVAARAFTVENDIYFAAGAYRPDTVDGLRVIGHELSHVIQQRRGLSRAALRGPGDPYEVEADAAGAAFATGGRPTVRAGSGGPTALQRSADPGAEAARVGVADSPNGLPFLGEAMTFEELTAMTAELAAAEGVTRLALVPEHLAAVGSASGDLVGTAAEPSGSGGEVQTSSLARPIQRWTVAGCHVPGAPPNIIGMAAHRQIEYSCMTQIGCLGEVTIPGDGRADLVRSRIPAITEIGEIKPASWIGRGLSALAQAQLLGYLLAYQAAYPTSAPPIPMWSFVFPGGPFLLNPSQALGAWGPSSGIYYYRCTGGRGRRVRVPVRVPVPVRSPSPAPDPATGPSGRDVARGAAAVGAGVGIGYLIYRGVRLIPSIAVPPTLIPNLIIP